MKLPLLDAHVVSVVSIPALGIDRALGTLRAPDGVRRPRVECGVDPFNTSFERRSGVDIVPVG